MIGSSLPWAWESELGTRLQCTRFSHLIGALRLGRGFMTTALTSPPLLFPCLPSRSLPFPHLFSLPNPSPPSATLPPLLFGLSGPFTSLMVLKISVNTQLCGLSGALRFACGSNNWCKQEACRLIGALCSARRFS